jgi:hypothetical protein
MANVPAAARDRTLRPTSAFVSPRDSAGLDEACVNETAVELEHGALRTAIVAALAQVHEAAAF